MKMARKREVCYSLSGDDGGNVSQVLIGKRVSCLPSTSPVKFALRLRHVIFLLSLLTLCHHLPNATSQPLLNQLAVLLRARPPWPTSFPTAASQQSNNVQQQQQQPQFIQQQQPNNVQQQQQQPQFIQQQQPNNVQQQQQTQFIQQQQSPSSISQQISMQSNHVYPTSTEQLQNFIASNNLFNPQGPLSQGIPVVAMDPSQNSITIMTPTGPEQIMGPNHSGMGGGGVFVAQPIQQNGNQAVHNNNSNKTASNNGNKVQNANSNGNNNNSPSGQIVQVLQNPVTFDGQNLIDGSMFAAGMPHLPPSGSANIAIAGMPANFHNEQHHFQPQQQHYQSGYIVHGPTGQASNMNTQSILNPQQQVVANGPLPPLPPIPKNLKGPAIIAVPKPVPSSQSPVLLPSPSYLGPLETNLQHLANNGNPSNGNTGVQPQPIIIHSFHQLPNLTPAFPQLLPQAHSFPHEHLISLPENAVMNLEMNKTSPIQNISPQQYFSNFQPSQPEQPQDHKQEQQKQQPEKIQPPVQPEKESFAELPHSELSSEIVGTPRNQRKRHQKQRQFHSQLQHTTRGIFRMKPTTRPTQIPQPAESESNQNEIDTPALSDYSLSTIINMPSTTITGSFEYPDPPTPPNFESMNALKYPSPFEDSAEVKVKNVPVSSSSSSSTTSRERKRLRDQLHEQLKSSLHLHNSPFGEVKRRRVTPVTSSTTTTTGTYSPTAAETSRVYSSITTAVALPETSVFESDAEIRDTTTFPASITTTTKKIKRDKHRRKGKSGRSRKSFRPSPQIHSFEEPVTGIKSYITILPPTTISGSDESDENTGRQRGKKSLFGKFEASESKHPPYEAGFKPVSQYTTYAMGKGSTIPSASTTTETLYFDLIREVVSKAPGKAWSKPDLNAIRENQRENRDLVTTVDGLTGSSATPYSSSTGNTNYRYSTLSSTSPTDSFVKAGWKVKDHLVSGDDGRRQVTTSASSERIEDWQFPDTTGGSTDSSKFYFGNGKFLPPNCQKFERFGFCPMNSGYPTDQVEKIASRCSALLSHLIAPLPKADVRYDVIVSKNGSMLKGRKAASSWQWKTFSGKPVCDTKEIKVVPGWAKNEQGEWLVILQTGAWKQEAQVTLCTPQGTHYNCKGNKTSGSRNNKDCTPIKIKCVQRFTAQRLATMDPDNSDRCPVLRSVFLPSACVCLHDSSPSKPSSSSSLVSSEELSVSSSSTNIVKISSKSNKGKKGTKGKKGSKKSSSSKRNKKSSVSGRTARKSNGNTSASSSSEETENKSDMLDTAADSSTSGARASGLNIGPTSETLPEREQRHQEEDDSVASPEDDEDNDVHEEGPHAERLISTPTSITTTQAEDDESEDEQNEVDDDDGNNAGDSLNEHKDNSTSKSLTANARSSITSGDGESRDANTVTSNSHGGSGTIADETSASEEHFEEKKIKEV